jgi:hypothetical protein
MMAFKVGATVDGRDVARGQLTMARALADAVLSLSDKVG